MAWSHRELRRVSHPTRLSQPGARGPSLNHPQQTLNGQEPLRVSKPLYPPGPPRGFRGPQPASVCKRLPPPGHFQGDYSPSSQADCRPRIARRTAVKCIFSTPEPGGPGPQRPRTRVNRRGTKPVTKGCGRAPCGDGPRPSLPDPTSSCHSLCPPSGGRRLSLTPSSTWVCCAGP